MTYTDQDVERLLDTLLLYVPPAPAQQFLGDLSRSRVAERDEAVREVAGRLARTLSRRRLAGVAGKEYGP